MKLTSPSNVRALLQDLDMNPSRNLGQNFLADQNILKIILDTAEVGADDRVLEIGPGLGVLTEHLVEMADHVTCVEIDNRLADHLATRFSDTPGFKLVRSDILHLDPEQIYGGITKLVANLPYSISSHAMMDLAKLASGPERIVITVQREVGERFCAEPGSKAYGLPSVWLQAVYECSIRKQVSRTCFWPRPKVDSVIVDMIRRDRRPDNDAVRDMFYVLSKDVFQHRRKQMHGILAHSAVLNDLDSAMAVDLLDRCGIDPSQRPGNLSPDDWLGLAAACVG